MCVSVYICVCECMSHCVFVCEYVKCVYRMSISTALYSPSLYKILHTLLQTTNFICWKL